MTGCDLYQPSDLSGPKEIKKGKVQMVTFVVKKKSVFFSQAAFQLFKFIQILFIYLPFSSEKNVWGLKRGYGSRWQVCLSGAPGYLERHVVEEEGTAFARKWPLSLGEWLNSIALCFSSNSKFSSKRLHVATGGNSVLLILAGI